MAIASRRAAQQAGRAAVVVGIAVMVSTAVAGRQGFASCAAPSIDLQPSGGVPGQDITVTGAAFLASCNDMGGPDGQAPPPAAPEKGVRLVFIQGDTKTILATVDADADYSFRVLTSVPDSAHRGRASVRAETEKLGDTPFPAPTVDKPFTVFAGASARAGWSRSTIASIALLVLAAIGFGWLWVSRVRRGVAEED